MILQNVRNLNYELVTSAPVVEELEDGNYPQKVDALQLISQLPLLSVDDRVMEVIDAYVQRHVMPRNPRGDAMHLALSSCHNCHFLLTWNCAHLANANKFEHIRHVNTMLGLFVPALVTPMELSEWREEQTL
jgi:hypothetical protein